MYIAQMVVRFRHINMAFRCMVRLDLSAVSYDINSQYLLGFFFFAYLFWIYLG